MFDQLIDEFAAKRAQLVETIKGEFHKIFVPMFEKYPEIEAFGVTAYAPYFNDGDPCVYRVHGWEIFLKDPDGKFIPGDDVEDEDEEIERVSANEGHIYWGLEEGPMKDDFKLLETALKKIPNDIMESAFDEGFICVTRKGITVEEYDHD